MSTTLPAAATEITREPFASPCCGRSMSFHGQIGNGTWQCGACGRTYRGDEYVRSIWSRVEARGGTTPKEADPMLLQTINHLASEFECAPSLASDDHLVLRFIGRNIVTGERIVPCGDVGSVHMEDADAAALIAVLEHGRAALASRRAAKAAPTNGSAHAAADCSSTPDGAPCAACAAEDPPAPEPEQLHCDPSAPTEAF